MGKARNEDCGPMDLNSLQFNIIRLELEEDASHTALSLVYMAIVYFLWPCRSRSALSGTRPLLVSMVYVYQSFPSSLSDLTNSAAIHLPRPKSIPALVKWNYHSPRTRIDFAIRPMPLATNCQVRQTARAC